MSKKEVSPFWTLIIYAPIVLGVTAWTWRSGRLVWPDAFILQSLMAVVVIWLIGFKYFGGTMVRPVWKIPGKLAFTVFFSYLLFVWIGPWAWLFILSHQALGFIGHVVICRRHGINWRNCEPREKYLELTTKWARGDFS